MADNKKVTSQDFQGRLITVFGTTGDGKTAPVYSVPTGNSLFWTAKAPNVEPNGVADVLLRRGNELIDLVASVPFSDVINGTTFKLPRLSPGLYVVEFKGYAANDDDKDKPIVSDEWKFRVEEPGKPVLVAEP